MTSSTTLKHRAFLVAVAVRLLVTAVGLAVLLLCGWLTPGRALVAGALLTAVVAGTAVYEVYISASDRASRLFVLIAGLLTGMCLVIAQLGSENLASAVIVAIILSLALSLSRRWITSQRDAPT